MKTNERELRKVDRDVERDRRGLEREEKKLETEIKKAVKQGNKQAATVLAKQLVQMRKQKTRTFVVQSQVRGANSQSKVMGANVKLAESMGQTTKVMGQMNKMVDPQKMAKTMMEFERENAKMEMTEETMNDALDDILTESGDEDEEQSVINQVLDEIGIEITSKVNEYIFYASKTCHFLNFKNSDTLFQVSNAPSAPKNTVKTNATSEEDKEIEAMLEKLKA